MRRTPKYFILRVRKLGLYGGRREEEEKRRREEKKRKRRRNPGLKIDIGLFGSMEFMFRTLVYVGMEPMYGFVG